jgi:molecular chaperone GrpE
MVNKNNENDDIELEITNNNDDTDDVDLEEIEEAGADKIKKIRTKLQACEADKMQAMEDLQRARAEFLNAKRRLEEERVQDKIKITKQHAEDLLPLCDSFQMAMDNKEVWEKADENWRKGVEGIHRQLLKLLSNYQVSKISALGQDFDPYRFEALDTVQVNEESEVDKVQQVLQEGYEMKVGETIEVIRPARVVTGILEN